MALEFLALGATTFSRTSSLIRGALSKRLMKDYPDLNKTAVAGLHVFVLPVMLVWWGVLHVSGLAPVYSFLYFARVFVGELHGDDPLAGKQLLKTGGLAEVANYRNSMAALFALLADLLFFGHVFSPVAMAGYLLVVGSSVLLTRQRRQLALQDTTIVTPNYATYGFWLALMGLILAVQFSLMKEAITLQPVFWTNIPVFQTFNLGLVLFFMGPAVGGALIRREIPWWAPVVIGLAFLGIVTMEVFGFAVLPLSVIMLVLMMEVVVAFLLDVYWYKEARWDATIAWAVGLKIAGVGMVIAGY